MSRIFKASNVIVNPKIKSIKNKNFQDSETKILNNLEEDKDSETLVDDSKILLFKAKNEANIIIENAKTEANLKSMEIINKAKSDANKIIEKSESEGFKKGYNEGLAEVESLKSDANLLIEEAVEEKNKILSSIEGEIVDLVLKITKKLLDNAAQINPQIILVLVKQGINNATLSGDICIRVSSQDYETVVQEKSEILKMTDNTAKLEIIRDLSLNKSDCIIETPFGNIDSSLDEQFKLLKEDLIFLLESRNYNED